MHKQVIRNIKEISKYQFKLMMSFVIIALVSTSVFSTQAKTSSRPIEAMSVASRNCLYCEETASQVDRDDQTNPNPTAIPTHEVSIDATSGVN